MPLSRAEIQKRYREKKKKYDDNFMQKERQRKRNAYVPVDQLGDRQLKKRRIDVKKRVKKHYKLKKILRNETNEIQVEKQMIVAMNFQTKKRNDVFRKKRSLALKKAYRDIEHLRDENEKLIREKKTVQKRLQRLKKKVVSDSTPSSSMSTPQDAPLRVNTPCSKTNTEMRTHGLTPSKHAAIRKKLLFTNIMVDHMKKKIPVSVKILKKYRCIRTAKSMIGKKWKKCLGVVNKARNQQRRKSLADQVVGFLEREDNCTILPGKKDCSSGKSKVQKRILNDYLHNLHRKFCLENPSTKISRSLFSKMRPKHVMLANFCNRKTCLCSRHQNLALKLRSLHNQGVGLSKNPDVVVTNWKNQEIENALKEDIKKEDVQYTEWKKVTEDGKARWRQVVNNKKKDEFCVMFMKDIEEFREHVDRVKTQYSEMKKLRENLPPDHVLVWMDFAENFTCSAQEEVQSAYWNTDMVTLHTSVIYLPSDHNKSHLSIVGISETMSHNANTVHAMIRELIPIIKTELLTLQVVHYLTDSPTSQYRNKTIFQITSDHEELFGVKATWDYLEAGHGKGPCDGLGASVKRSADNAIKQGKTTIQNASEFYEWASQTDSVSVVKYYFVSQEDYNRSEILLREKSRGLKPVPKTMLIHSVKPTSLTNEVAVRVKSCHCDQCLLDVKNTSCSGWKFHFLKENFEEDGNVEETAMNDQQHGTGNNAEITFKPSVGQYVISVYDGKQYIGLVTEIDHLEEDAKINFMKESTTKRHCYIWPSPKDELWVSFQDILFSISEPIACGKSKRVYQLTDEDSVKIGEYM